MKQQANFGTLIAMKSAKKRSKPRPDKSQPLLRQLAAVPAKLFSGAFRQQYGALCFRHAKGGAVIEILVITSRESARWVIPDGR